MSLSTANTTPLVYALDEKPPHWLALSLGVQHVLLMFTGVLVVPTILSKTGQASAEQIEYLAFASILVCSLTTFLQVVRVGRVGANQVLFMGTSGAFLACTFEAIALGGVALAATMAMLAAPLEILFSYFFRFLRKIMTPAVGGVVIMLIAVSVIPIALDLWVGPAKTPEHNSVENLVIGLVTLALIVGLSIFGGKTWRIWAPVIGIAGGYLMAAGLGSLHLGTVQQTAWFGLPRADWPGLQFALKLEHWPIFVCFALATIVGTIESVGDAIAAQKVSQRDFRKIDYDVVQGALYADGVGNFLSGLVGTTPNTTYSGNIALIEMTGVSSRRVGLYGAGVLGLLAFFPKAAAFIIDIPGPAIGASIFILMGMLFFTGIKIATMDGVDAETVLIVGLSFWFGYAAENELFFAALIPESIRPLVGNGLVAGGTLALLLATLVQLKPRRAQRIKIPAQASALGQLQDFIETLDGRLSLTPQQRHNLHLCSEEVFIHLCQAEREAQTGQYIAFQVSAGEQGVLMEIADRSAATDVDFPRPPQLPQLPTDLEMTSAEELDELGLFLVSKIAAQVSHQRIAGHNYIAFTIMA